MRKAGLNEHISFPFVYKGEAAKDLLKQSNIILLKNDVGFSFLLLKVFPYIFVKLLKLNIMYCNANCNRNVLTWPYLLKLRVYIFTL